MTETMTELDETDIAEERKSVVEKLRSFKKPERKERKLKLNLTPG